VFDFGAQSLGLGSRCLRFAAGVAPGPRKTRFRLVAGLCRAGFAPAESVERFQPSTSASSSPRLGLAQPNWNWLRAVAALLQQALAAKAAMSSQLSFARAAHRRRVPGRRRSTSSQRQPVGGDAGAEDARPKRKTPDPLSRIGGFGEKIRQRPTLPRGFPRSTIGSGGLNFRVRDGNGCDPSDIATGKLSNCTRRVELSVPDWNCRHFRRPLFEGASTLISNPLHPGGSCQEIEVKVSRTTD
jgi:hypothetical protein